MAKNPDCAISDSALCKWLGKDCRECQIASMKHADDIKKALADFEVTLSLLPEDFDELQGEECQFCKADPGKRYRYALTDFGNPEPKSETGMFFGIGKKVRRRVGSLMPMSISICKGCRRAFLFADITKWIVTIVFLAASIGILAIPPIGAGLGQEVALLIVAGATVLGYLIGRVISAAYVKSKSERVRFNVFDIPICKSMQDLGWFTVQDETPVSRFIFSRKSLTHKLKDVLEQKEAEDGAV